jgi:phage-related holin
MHTIIVLAVGFVLLGLCALTGRVLGNTSGIATAALIFLPFWLVGAGINMYMGVKRAGYSVADEAPIFVLVSAVPAAAAVVLWWTLSS